MQLTAFGVSRNLGCTAATLLGLSVALAGAVTEAPDDRVLIKLKLNGVAVAGSQERSKELRSKSPSEQEAILNRQLPQLAPGREYELSVLVIDNNAAMPRDFTASSQVEYETFGCLTIRGSTTLLVKASAQCSGPEYPSLLVLFKSAAGVPLAYNEYLFRVPAR